MKPLAAERYEIRFTASAATRDKLKVAQDLLRHAIPSGDVAAIFDRALSELIEAHSPRAFLEYHHVVPYAVGGNRGTAGRAERLEKRAISWEFSPVPERPQGAPRSPEETG